jgi:O-methyltransferase
MLNIVKCLYDQKDFKDFIEYHQNEEAGNMKPVKILEKVLGLNSHLVYRILQMNNNLIRTDKCFIDAYWELVKDDKMILSIREAYNIYYYLNSTTKLKGAVAELGVYKGGGAKLISKFRSELPLHLFDTFEGMPKVNKAIDLHNEGDFSDSSLEGVKNYLKDFPNIHFHKGFFPNTTVELPDNIEYSFVHLDVDIYDSTLAGLNYFYPRLVKGGVIISHDYNAISCPGVKKAFDEFFMNKDQEVIPLWDTQCMLRKYS